MRLKANILALAVLFAGTIGVVACRAQEADLVVDWDETHQTIVGFGGTMGWIHPHPERREEVFDLLFNKLGVSVLRIRALGDEASQEGSLEPENDNDDPGEFNWAAFPIARTEAENAIIIQAAQERGVRVIIPTAWSPPGWMKDSGVRAGGGNLREDMLHEYAELWAAYVIGMRKAFGVAVSFISIQNEPDMEYYYATCGIEPELYAKAAAAVIERFEHEGLNVRVLGPDTCRVYNVPRYVEALEQMNVAPGAPILTHLYDLLISFHRVDRDPERWHEARELARGSGRPLWLTETANYLSYGVRAATYEEAIIWAQKIHSALVDGDCEVVCYWSLFFDKPEEALIYCPESQNADYLITRKFYTSMHYYRFVRPGMVRCTAEAGGGLLASAFKGEEGARVLVILNPTQEPGSVNLPVEVDENWHRYQTDREQDCARVAWEEGRTVLPPQSVTTLVRGDRAGP